MKDLKHLIWFEDLLQQANNELVQRAAAEGQLALGYNCYYIPEVLLNLPGCFSSRLLGPQQRHRRDRVLLHDKPQLSLCPLHPGAGH